MIEESEPGGVRRAAPFADLTIPSLFGACAWTAPRVAVRRRPVRDGADQ